MRILAGELNPVSGKVTTSPNAKLGYFGQSNIARLSPNKTVEQEVSDANLKHHRTVVRTICGTMMFPGDDALKKVSVLSGGEKSRVLLGKLLAQPSNFLLLDEPTNHLDMESIEALINSLKTYSGTVVIVTHSELILRELAQRLVIFDGNVPRLFDHDYQYFLEKEGWGDEEEMSASNAKSGESKKQKPAREKREKSVAKRLEEAEARMAEIDSQIQQVEAELVRLATSNDRAQATALGAKLKELQTAAMEAYSAWEELATLES